MIDTEALKRKVLDLAIKGKLVPQDTNDEPASQLLERIKIERDRLIDEGKIKGKKDDFSYIFKGDDNCYYEKIGKEVRNITDELPFEIPENWCLTKVKYISKTMNGYAFKKETFMNSGLYPIIKIGNISPLGIDLFNVQYCNFNPGENYSIKNGDLLIALSGATTGKMCFAQVDKTMFINQRVMALRFAKFIDPLLYSQIISIYTKKILDSAYGGAQPNISSTEIENLLVPIIPLNQQHKICLKLTKIINDLNNIKSLQMEIGLIKNSLKSKIINLGIQGKLLVADDNYYSKKIACISSLLNDSFYGDGNWVLSEDMETDSILKLIQLGNIGDGSYIDKKLKSVKYNYKTNNDCKYIHNGYLLINRLIANRMYACIFESELNNEYITSVDVCWIKPNEIVNLRYLLYIMLSIDTQQQVLQKASGSTRKRISKKNLININFKYFEDLEVQKQIVESIEKTLRLLNC